MNTMNNFNFLENCRKVDDNHQKITVSYEIIVEYLMRNRKCHKNNVQH